MDARGRTNSLLAGGEGEAKFRIEVDHRCWCLSYLRDDESLMSIFASSFRIVEETSTGVCFTGFFAGVLDGVIGMGFWRRVADADEATSEIIY